MRVEPGALTAAERKVAENEQRKPRARKTLMTRLVLDAGGLIAIERDRSLWAALKVAGLFMRTTPLLAADLSRMAQCGADTSQPAREQAPAPTRLDYCAVDVPPLRFACACGSRRPIWRSQPVPTAH